MFLDGVIMAHRPEPADGRGSFRFPVYLQTDLPFHDHPPLAFAMQAAWFEVFGDHLAVERAYGFAMGALTAVLIVAAWRNAGGAKTLGWLPLVFWLVPSTVTWSIVNNLLQTTGTVFTTAAGTRLRAVAHRHAWGGHVGRRSRSRRARGGAGHRSGRRVPSRRTGDGAPGPGAPSASRRPERRDHGGHGPCRGRGSLDVHRRGCRDSGVLARPDRRVGDRRSRRSAMVEFARHSTGAVLLRMVVLLALIAVIAGRSRHESQPASGSVAWGGFFLLLGLAGSLPTAVSARVSGHYLVPSLPVFALGFAFLSERLARPRLEAWVSSARTGPVLRALAAVLFVAAVALPGERTPDGAARPRLDRGISDNRGAAATSRGGADLPGRGAGGRSPRLLAAVLPGQRGFGGRSRAPVFPEAEGSAVRTAARVRADCRDIAVLAVRVPSGEVRGELRALEGNGDVGPSRRMDVGASRRMEMLEVPDFSKTKQRRQRRNRRRQMGFSSKREPELFPFPPFPPLSPLLRLRSGTSCISRCPAARIPRLPSSEVPPASPVAPQLQFPRCNGGSLDETDRRASAGTDAGRGRGRDALGAARVARLFGQPRQLALRGGDADHQGERRAVAGRLELRRQG